MNPLCFLDVAESLSKQQDEAAIRTSVGRSYFALYNLVACFLTGEGFSLDGTATDHETSKRWLFNSGIADAKEVAGVLDDLRDERNQADYEMELTKFQSSQTACFVLLKARQAFVKFENCTGSKKKRVQLVKRIRQHIEIVGS